MSIHYFLPFLPQLQLRKYFLKASCEQFWWSGFVMCNIFRIRILSIILQWNSTAPCLWFVSNILLLPAVWWLREQRMLYREASCIRLFLRGTGLLLRIHYIETFVKKGWLILRPQFFSSCISVQMPSSGVFPFYMLLSALFVSPVVMTKPSLIFVFISVCS